MDKTIGILGGGQLGRMLTEAANRLNIRVLTLETSPSSPAKQVSSYPDHVTGSFSDPAAIRTLASRVDILTIEIEHVDTDVLEEIAEGYSVGRDWRRTGERKVTCQPSWRTIEIIRDKFGQKEWLEENNCPVAMAVALDTEDGDKATKVKMIVEKDSGGKYPVMLKARTEAYDGRGNFKIAKREDIGKGLEVLGGNKGGLYIEAWADFQKELAVMVIKVEEEDDLGFKQATLVYPVVETVHEDSICKLVYAPAEVTDEVRDRAQVLARKAVAGFWGKGVFGVEMFWLKNGKLLINEIAPRVHNSGHYTIDACPMSQFEAHLRAILDLSIPSSSLSADSPSVMLNILGGARPDSHLRVRERALSIPRAAIHMYGKGDGRPGRKMGHVTVTASTLEEAKRNIAPLVELVDEIRAEAKAAPSSAPKPTPNAVSMKPFVAVTMGSDSDLKVLRPGIELLEKFGVLHSVTIKSAHRTSEEMVAFAKGAASKGVKVIIAGAGGAAHLPGMIAANTILPVVGVPVKGSSLEGMDSLLSIVQMPRGCPVATMAINNSVNAALYSIRILALTDVGVRNQLEKYMDDERDSVVKKNERLQEVGYEEYARTM